MVLVPVLVPVPQLWPEMRLGFRCLTALTTFQQPLHFALPDSIVPIVDTLCDFVDTCMPELNMDPSYTIEYFGITDDP